MSQPRRFTRRLSFLGLLLVALPVTACAGQDERPPLTPTAETVAPAPAAVKAPPPPAPAALSPAIEEKAVADATGVEKVEKGPDGALKVTFPRKDVEVTVDGWKVPPFMGLTSWVAFTPAQKGIADAMMAGDLVLFEDEVNPVISVLLEYQVQVTAIHNHFFYDAPHVFFMHVGGEGTVATLGGGVRVAMNAIAKIRMQSPKPAHGYGAPPLPAKNAIDAAKLEALLGVKGEAKDGMFKATMGRSARATCGCGIGKTMGVSTWAAFAGSNENALVDGDFAVGERELQPVLKALRAGGINIVAIHHHMTGETPRILFLHYWGRGKAAELASTVKNALDLTAWDQPKPQST
ncbi:MAG TPA: DUF1259 domain-containing protein [Polyangiaceae bacterium]|jgi:hypothetical protein|nr:DUF1259 domain-containing protein [Polyangiaceae bacterium]